MKTISLLSLNIIETNMNIFKRLREKYQASKVSKKYLSKSTNVLIKTFHRGYYLSKKGIGWDLKSFDNKARVFNLTGDIESFKFPTHFAIKGNNGTVYMFSGLKTGSNKDHKVSGEFNKFDDSFINRMKNFLASRVDGGKEVLETLPEDKTVDVHLNEFDRLYLTAVCKLNTPHKVVYFDKQIKIYDLKNKIKEMLIEDYSNMRDTNE